MTNAPAPLVPPAVAANLRGRRRALRRAAAVAAAGLFAASMAGCGGAAQSQTPPPRRPTTTAADELLNLPPVETPDVEPMPTTAAATTEPALVDVGGDSAVPSATRPATLPDVESGVAVTQPSTEPATAPTTAQAVAEAAAPREPDLLLVENATPADVALAGILETYGEGTLLDASGSPDLADQGEALLTAAVRLAPQDARIARALVEARLRIGDVAGGLEALDHYRKLKPEDVLAQIRYVDLAGDEMQSADAKLDYLTRVAESDRVSDEVRSHAAAMAALLSRETLDYSGADDLIRRAVELDPYSPLALQLDYERLLSSNAGRSQRVEALAKLARSNPIQPAVLTRLAGESLAAGLGESANEFYDAALQAYAVLGLAAPGGTLTDAASMKIVTNRPGDVPGIAAAANKRTAARLATGEPLPPDLAAAQADSGLLTLLAAKAGRGSKPLADLAPEVTNLLRATLLLPTHARLAGEAPPAPPAEGQPYPPTPLPDVVADAQKLADPATPADARRGGESYAGALSALAWVDLYFLEKPTDPALLRALELLVPEQSATLVRLKGWQLWRQGQDDAAAVKLATASDRDALSALGLLLMGRPATTEPAAAEASPAAQMQGLLQAVPNGLVGAFISDAVRHKGVLLQPGDDAAPVRQALTMFETRLLRVMRPENLGEFYSLDARPLKVSHGYGEPLLMTVTLRNKGRDAITVGPEALVKSNLRLDTRVSGGMSAATQVPAAAEPEWTGGTVLQPGEKLEQVVRLDGPRLAGPLGSLPQQRLTVTADVTSNPRIIPTPQGDSYATGPAGITVSAERLIDREGVPLDLKNEQVAANLNARLGQLRSGDPLERLRAAQLVLGEIRWLAGYVDQQKKNGASDEQLADFRQIGAQLFDALQRAAGAYAVPQGEEAAATAWLKFAAASVAAPEQRGPALQGLLSSPAFEARVIGLLASGTLTGDAEQVQALVGPLAENDPDPTVRRLAQAQLRYVRSRPTTAPAATTP